MPSLAGLHYQSYPEAGGQPALILLHGAGGSHLSWPVAIRRLPRTHVFALDLPGHGNSTGSGAQSISAYALQVHAWIEAAGLAKVVLAGHSMGGAIALSLALEHPQDVIGLALLGSAARLMVNPALIEAASSPEGHLDAVAKVIQWSFSRNAPANLRRLVSRRLAEVSPKVLHCDFLACNAFDARASLSQVGCPTLVMCGAEDRMTPVSESRVLAETIPGARLRVIAGAGHMVMLEKPLEVAEALGEFIGDIAQADGKLH